MNGIPDAFVETGWQLWLVVAIIMLPVGIVLTLVQAFAASRLRNSRPDSEVFALPIIGAIFAALAVLIALCMIVVGPFPYDAKYRHYYEVEGNVTEVSNVLAEGDGGFTRVPVITLDNVERPLVVDDPRAVSIEGEDVRLRCTISWNYAAADTYTCRIVAYGSDLS